MEGIFSSKKYSINASIKDIDGKKGIVTGYFASFDNVDSDGDIIKKGAFAKTIMEWGPGSSQPRIKHLMNHNIAQPLGKLITLSEDTQGLNYESQIGTHTLGKDFINMVDSGLITEHSIGYQTMKRNQLQDYEGYMKNPAGGWYELTDLKLYEGSSLTAWGVNQNTPLIGMKSEQKKEFLQSLISRQKNIEKFCRNSTASDETIELLLIECKQLTQHIIEITEQPKNDTPQPKIDAGLVDIIKSFTNSLKK